MPSYGVSLLSGGLDSTTVTALAKGKTDTGRIWTYVRDDLPFGAQSPPAALYYASRNRRQEHPERHLKTFTGILQADAYSGYNPLFKVDRDPGPLTQALCWSHARRKFFELADFGGRLDTATQTTLSNTAWRLRDLARVERLLPDFSLAHGRAS